MKNLWSTSRRHLDRTARLMFFMTLAAGCPAKQQAAPAGGQDLAVRGTPTGAVRSNSSSRTAWPSLPRTSAEARALIARFTRRPPGDGRIAVPPTASGILELLGRRQLAGDVAAGWPAITETLGARLASARSDHKDAFLLWGTHHDSGVQVRAFRRMVGPEGPGGWSWISMEQLRAPGRWAGLEEQRVAADSQHLQAFLETGDRRSLNRLIWRQRQFNYTAWKYGYQDEFTDLLLSARALGLTALGCDMPEPLQKRIQELPLEDRNRLRELHCLLAVQERARPAGPLRAAMLWGAEHISARGLPRLISEDHLVLTVAVMGGRPGKLGLERELGRRLGLTHPVIFPVDDQGDQLLLLLDEGWLDRPLARAHDRLVKPLPRRKRGIVQISSDQPGELTIDGRMHPVDRELVITLSLGTHTFLFLTGDRQIAGRLVIPSGGGAELHLSADSAVQLTTRGLGDPAP